MPKRKLTQANESDAAPKETKWVDEFTGEPVPAGHPNGIKPGAYRSRQYRAKWVNEFTGESVPVGHPDGIKLGAYKSRQQRAKKKKNAMQQPPAACQQPQQPQQPQQLNQLQQPQQLSQLQQLQQLHPPLLSPVAASISAVAPLALSQAIQSSGEPAASSAHAGRSFPFPLSNRDGIGSIHQLQDYNYSHTEMDALFDQSSVGAVGAAQDPFLNPLSEDSDYENDKQFDEHDEYEANALRKNSLFKGNKQSVEPFKSDTGQNAIFLEEEGETTSLLNPQQPVSFFPQENVSSSSSNQCNNSGFDPEELSRLLTSIHGK